nr:hypothetical protein [Tanacetum cinerariifolium]
HSRSFPGARPIGIERFDSWDLGTGSHGVLGEVDDTVQVDAGVRERAVGEKGFWREMQLGSLLGSG